MGDEEVKHRIAGERPYRLWLSENLVVEEDLPADLDALVLAAAAVGLVVLAALAFERRDLRA